MHLFVTVVNGFQSLTIICKSSILDVSKGFGYISEYYERFLEIFINFLMWSTVLLKTEKNGLIENRSWRSGDELIKLTLTERAQQKFIGPCQTSAMDVFAKNSYRHHYQFMEDFCYNH